MKRWAAVAAICMLMVPALVSAHESRPGFLEITESSPGRYEVYWKVPRRGDMVLSLKPVLPGHCTDVIPAAKSVTPGAFVERRFVDCGEAGLIGEAISIDGLTSTITDVLARVVQLDGSTQTVIVKPSEPSFVVEGTQSTAQLAGAYVRLGVEHILFGIDHLLFVLGLMLLVNGVGQLVKTITAFTVAHSITLGLAALGFVHVPQPPIEAVIALSILFLATELLKKNHGQIGLTERFPWIVALTFGLLHGFGFAGALSEIGLPENAIPLALFTFNVGVEIGQLLFVAAVLIVIQLLKRLQLQWPDWSRSLPAYAIGSLAAFWCIQRVTGFW